MYNSFIVYPDDYSSLETFIKKVTNTINDFGDKFVSVNYLTLGVSDDLYAIILYKED